MFNYRYTVFGCASSGKFYLHRGPWKAQLGPLDAFHGVFPSVDAFIEQADWNSVDRLKLVGSMESIILSSTAAMAESRVAPPLPLVNPRGLRIAAQEPYQKRTLMDLSPPPGTLGYLPRKSSGWRRPKDKYHRVSEWPRLPDSALPEPWTCDWEIFPDADEWYTQAHWDLEEAYGGALLGYIPAFFRQLDEWDYNGRGDVVLCPPGGAGTYYLWTSDFWEEFCDPRNPDMQRFQGIFASVEHFIRAANWNTLEEVPWLVYSDLYDYYRSGVDKSQVPPPVQKQSSIHT